jgi:hypothetical protein
MVVKNKLLIFLFLILTGSLIRAQSKISIPSYLKTEIKDSIKVEILNSLDSLFAGIDGGKINAGLVDRENFDFSMSFCESFRGLENNGTAKNFYKRQLINLYPVSASEYLLSIAFVGNQGQEPVIGGIYNIIARNDNNKIFFSNPIKYLTKTWKTMVLGDITYYYRDTINLKRATEFNEKNRTMAVKLGLTPIKFNFYMCQNFQEIFHIIGCEYDAQNNGTANSGYIVDPNNLFSIMNNEDFSHDVFHIYAAKIRKQKRNRAAEEGIAYSWGNAYYADNNGEIANQKELVTALRKYLRENPRMDLLDLFDNSPKIFNYGSDKISVKSVISGVICDEVERKKGIEGIKQLIDCGYGDENLFKCIDELVQINRDNFSKKVTALIEHE